MTGFLNFIDCHDFAKVKSRNDIISYIFATNLHIFTKKFKKILHFFFDMRVICPIFATKELTFILLKRADSALPCVIISKIIYYANVKI